MSENTSVMRLKHTRRSSGIFKSLLVGFLSAAAFLFVFVLLFAGIFFKNEDPGKFLFPVSVGILLFTAFLFGFVSAKSYGRKGAFMGALSGGVLFVILFLLALILGFLKENATVTCIFYLAMAIVAILGGALGGKKRAVKRKLSFR